MEVGQLQNGVEAKERQLTQVQARRHQLRHHQGKMLPNCGVLVLLWINCMCFPPTSAPRTEAFWHVAQLQVGPHHSICCSVAQMCRGHKIMERTKPFLGWLVASMHQTLKSAKKITDGASHTMRAWLCLQPWQQCAGK